MVCSRCIMVVEDLFKSVSLEPVAVSLGEVKLLAPMSDGQRSEIREKLLKKGFELIDDDKSLLLEQIKAIIIEEIHHRDHFELKLNWSHHLAEKLGVDYGYLSALFSTVTGITLEQYIIKQKVEKVKEYLFYDELSVKEIAFKLGYSSVAHLSTQFKKMTGLTPTAFKEARGKADRTALDQV